MPRNIYDVSQNKKLTAPINKQVNKQEREEREAKALRQNLLKRKQQMRARSAETSSLMSALRHEEPIE